MKTVELFMNSPFVSDRTQRTFNAGGRVLNLLRKGSKVSPVVIWTEAAIAVADAISAYSRLQQSKEITKQLRIELVELEKRLDKMRKMFAIDEALWQGEREQREAALDAALNKNQQARARFLKDMSARRESMDTLAALLKRLRNEPRSDSKELRQMTETFDRLMQAQLQCLIAAFEDDQ